MGRSCLYCGRLVAGQNESGGVRGREKMSAKGVEQNYKMVVEIPILNVPNTVSIQEAKVVSEVWLRTQISDAKLISFALEKPCQKK